MKNTDILSEFHLAYLKPKSLPWLYTSLLIILGFSGIVLIKNIQRGSFEFEFDKTIILVFLFFVYTLIGVAGFFNKKTYGWVISANIFLLSSIICLGILLLSGLKMFKFQDWEESIYSLIYLFFNGASFAGTILIFNRTVKKYFCITYMQAASSIIVTVFILLTLILLSVG